MSTLSQTQTVLKHLEKRSITSIEAISQYRITRLAARIADLRERGHVILSLKDTSAQGKRYARYSLVKKGAKHGK